MCGIFGVILFEDKPSEHVRKVLQQMMRVTMMRGAQSAGATAPSFAQRSHILIAAWSYHLLVMT